MLRTTQDSRVSVHEDIALHIVTVSLSLNTVTVSLFTDVVLHTVEVIIFTNL